MVPLEVLFYYFLLCHFTAGLSFIIYLASLQLAHQPPKESLFPWDWLQKYISISEQQIVPIADCKCLPVCIYFGSTCVVVQVSLWMSPHPLLLLWCGLSLSLIIAPSYPVSTFWCFLCAHPDRISNKKSLSFWFFAEWVRWPLAFSLHYLVGRKTNWGGNMCKIFWICCVTALLSTVLCEQPGANKSAIFQKKQNDASIDFPGSKNQTN